MMLRGLALALSFALAACTVDKLPIAKVDMSDGGEDGDSDGGQDSFGDEEQPLPCKSNDDCDDGEYCEKCDDGAHCEKSCDPGAPGRCLPQPTVCPPSQEAPVCGCDRFTYFDDCLRRRKGVSLAGWGECPPRFAMQCGGPGGPCPEGSSCAKLLFLDMQCAPDPPGRCWVLPSACSTPAGGDRWNACGMTGSGSNMEPIGSGDRDVCIDTCAAIQSEQPHWRADRCQS